MEPNENNELENQPLAPQDQASPIQSEPVPPRSEPAQPEPYHNSGAGRKESPYADSPYVFQGQQEYRYQPQSQPAPKPPKAPRSHTGAGRRILSAVLILVLVVSSCLITAAAINDHWEERTEDTVEMLNEKIEALRSQIPQASNTPVDRSPLADGEALTPGELYAQNVNSVVNITSTVYAEGPFGPTEGTTGGSGFILSEDGYLVTNYHVVENAVSVTVTTHDGESHSAKVVGYDAANDVAVLKIEATGLPTVVIGKSSDLAIGDMVVAIGNPMGMTATQTVGYVSGINREVRTDSTVINMIQTDAAINPGNSGGPLFNMRGEVIGIATAKYSSTSIEGICFAIPIDDVIGLIADLVDYGYVKGAYMGVTVSDTDPKAAAMYGLPTGAYVVTVEEGGAADRAGIQPKDIIIGLDGQQIGSMNELTRTLRQYKPGDTASVTVIRAGSEMTMDITFDERPRDTTADTETVPMPDEGDYEEWYEYFRRYFGK